MSRPIDEKTHSYLGDGLYVQSDPMMVTLSCDRADGVHYVCLEYDVAQAFVSYLKKIGWAREAKS